VLHLPLGKVMLAEQVTPLTVMLAVAVAVRVQLAVMPLLVLLVTAVLV
jgi:hypothetical protein